MAAGAVSGGMRVLKLKSMETTESNIRQVKSPHFIS